MPNPRLLGIVTALLVIGKVSGVQAAYTFSQLQAVESLIQSKDCTALLNYLSDNSEMLEGSDPLAEELRKFTLGVDGGLIECLSAQPGGVAPLAEPAPTY